MACAVSGGADSLALLVLGCAAGCAVTAIHVDHGLRAGSAAEADVVRAAAARYGARFVAESVQVPAGPNLEARARAARFGVLPPGVLTGHTADDQAETVLLNLLRGSGLDGLAGMGAGGHPLLRVRRAETRALCEAEGLAWVEDPSNVDPVHRRNRVRAELLPLMEAIAERDVAALLARQADVLRDEAELLDSLAAAVDVCDARALAAAPPVLARRAVRQWLAGGASGLFRGRSPQISGRFASKDVSGGYPPDLATVERVLAVARGESLATDVGGGRRVARRQGRLRLE